RRRLISELRRQRAAAELSQEQVAEEMDWSLSKLIRVESGAVGISTNDLRALLSLYGITDRVRINEMVELAKAARQKMWWNDHRGVISPQYTTFIGFEAEAVVIRQFHLIVIPGLLQTEAYARVLHGLPGAVEIDEQQVDAKTVIRLERGRQVLERDDPPDYHVVIDESVIRRQVGGVAVMRDQLTRLLEMAKRPNITLRIAPFDRGELIVPLNATFTIFEFADPAVGDVLFLGGPDREELNESPTDVDRYRDAFTELANLALTERESVELIERAQQDLR
ncbi:MAG: helix-turn-helix domain-containing protein, partial [Micromonosporaceae bacterium]|nr:helix-turn-helix domain-containing protein [Micromonosporaceae bacterium]